MRDLDNSLGFNFSRFSSNGWHNFPIDDNSHALSIMSKQLNNNPIEFQFQAMLHEPPQPAASIYGCLQSQPSENGSIKQVEYVQGEPQAKSVNSKQYFRMMKRRIKKVMSKFAKNQNIPINEQPQEEDKKKRKTYLYESRHRHAVVRPRGKDGKFLATRPQSERFREKKKRGRKPKNKQPEITVQKPKIKLQKKTDKTLQSIQQIDFEKPIYDLQAKN